VAVDQGEFGKNVEFRPVKEIAEVGVWEGETVCPLPSVKI